MSNISKRRDSIKVYVVVDANADRHEKCEVAALKCDVIVKYI